MLRFSWSTSSSQGQLRGEEEIALQLRSITVNSKTYSLASELVSPGGCSTAIDQESRCVAVQAGGSTWINVEIEYDLLRDDPRFQDLLRRMNLMP